MLDDTKARLVSVQMKLQELTNKLTILDMVLTSVENDLVVYETPAEDLAIAS
jgi:hypothetical protein